MGCFVGCFVLLLLDLLIYKAQRGLLSACSSSFTNKAHGFVLLIRRFGLRSLFLGVWNYINYMLRVRAILLPWNGVVFAYGAKPINCPIELRLPYAFTRARIDSSSTP